MYIKMDVEIKINENIFFRINKGKYYLKLIKII